MRPVSARFLEAIRGSHQAVFEVRVCETTQQTGTNPTGTIIPISGGDVQWDIESDILATVELTCPDGSLYPTSPQSLLAPYGNELFIRRGIVFGNGVTEWVSLGYFRIKRVEQDDARGGEIRISGQDRMSRIVANPVTVVQFFATDTRGYLVSFLIATASMTVTIEWDSTSVRDGQIGRTIVLDNNRWEVLNDFITGLGKIWYFDYRGVLVIKTPPALTSPVWEVDAGDNGVLVSMGQSLDDEGVFNYVQVDGATPDNDLDPQVSGVNADGDITSPTWTGSKFGVVSKLVENSEVTAFTLNNYLNALLKASLGFPKQIDFTAVPNPALEPYDPVLVRLSSTVADTHVIRKLTIGLSPESPVTAETREYVNREF